MCVRVQFSRYAHEWCAFTIIYRRLCAVAVNVFATNFVMDDWISENLRFNNRTFASVHQMSAYAFSNQRQLGGGGCCNIRRRVLLKPPCGKSMELGQMIEDSIASAIFWSWWRRVNIRPPHLPCRFVLKSLWTFLCDLFYFAFLSGYISFMALPAENILFSIN